jgi:hypothetical protein
MSATGPTDISCPMPTANSLRIAVDRFLSGKRALVLVAALLSFAMPLQAIAQRFEVTFSSAAHTGPITGRLILFLARAAQPEPRLALSPRGPAIFGVDLDQLRPDQAVVVDNSAIGYPMAMADLPPGDYVAQAVINVYEHVRRADGKSIWVHLNDGSVEFFNTAAGNVYSDPIPVKVGRDSTIKLTITRVIPPRTRPQDTEWVKHVQIQSQILTR